VERKKQTDDVDLIIWLKWAGVALKVKVDVVDGTAGGDYRMV
jgi:hypothetical protein